MRAKVKRTNKGEKSAHTISKGRLFNFRPALFCALAMICGVLFAVAALEEGKGKACLFLVVFLAMTIACCIVPLLQEKSCSDGELNDADGKGESVLKDADESDCGASGENSGRNGCGNACERNGCGNAESCGRGGFKNGCEENVGGDGVVACGEVGEGRREVRARRKKISFSSIRAVLLCLFFAFGACSFAVRRADYKNANVYGKAECVARVTERREYGYYVLLTFDRLSFDGRKADGKMRTLTRNDGGFERVSESDVVTFLAEVKTNTAWREKKEDGTRRRTYEWLCDIRYEAADLTLVSVQKGAPSGFARVRTRLKTVLDANMDEDAAAIAFALLTGDSAEMDGELLNNFRYGGVAHVFAVSGLHVGALFAFLAAILKRVRSGKLPGIVKWLAVCALLCLYGGVCGYSASVVRAITACLVGYADALIAVKRDSAEGLAKAAIVVLGVSPFYLFDVGFLLSFAAAAGILCLTPTLKRAAYLVAFGDERGGRSEKRETTVAVARVAESERSEKRERASGCTDEAESAVAVRANNGEGGKERNGKRCGAAVKKPIDFFAVTIAATLATLPILTCAFGYASVIALFLNLLIVPIVSALFSPFLVLAFFSAAFPWVGSVALYIPSVLFSPLSTTFYAADYAAFLVGVPFTTLSTVAYYAALILASDKLNVAARVRICAVAVGICAVVCGFFA